MAETRIASQEGLQIHIKLKQFCFFDFQTHANSAQVNSYYEVRLELLFPEVRLDD